MKRAKVSDSLTGKPRFVEYRISKSAFLTDKQYPCLAKITRRITAMTRLQMRFVEALQVVNYGLGGQYEPHHDYFVHPSKEKHGNRIATVMFYVSLPLQHLI
jgi:prolyl 4-hydroxylase